MPKLSEILTTTGENIAGGLSLGADKFGKRVTEDITEERRLPLRTEVAGRLGLIPEEANKIKTELQDLKTMGFAGYIQSKSGQPDAEPTKTKNIATFNKLAGLVSNNKEFLISKGYSSTKIDEVVRTLKDGSINKTAPKLLDTINVGKGVGAYTRFKKELETTPEKQVASISPEQKAKLTEEYNEKVKDLSDKYKVVLHRDLPYYKDLLALLQFGERNLQRGTISPIAKTGFYAPKDISKIVDDYSKTLDNEILKEVKGDTFGFGSVVVKNAVANEYNNIVTEMRRFSTELGRFQARAENISAKEGGPTLMVLGRMPNINTPMLTDVRAMSEDEAEVEGETKKGFFRSSAANRIAKDPLVRKAILENVKGDFKTSGKNLFDESKTPLIAKKMAIAKMITEKNELIRSSGGKLNDADFTNFFNSGFGKGVLANLENTYSLYLKTIQKRGHVDDFINTLNLQKRAEK